METRECPRNKPRHSDRKNLKVSPLNVLKTWTTEHKLRNPLFREYSDNDTVSMEFMQGFSSNMFQEGLFTEVHRLP